MWGVGGPSLEMRVIHIYSICVLLLLLVMVLQRIFGDSREDTTAFMRLCNVINCVTGRYDE